MGNIENFVKSTGGSVQGFLDAMQKRDEGDSARQLVDAALGKGGPGSGRRPGGGGDQYAHTPGDSNRGAGDRHVLASGKDAQSLREHLGQ